MSFNVLLREDAPEFRLKVFIGLWGEVNAIAVPSLTIFSTGGQRDVREVMLNRKPPSSSLSDELSGSEELGSDPEIDSEVDCVYSSSSRI